MATLIENLVGRGLNVKDYEFHARRFFCQPSKRTLALAEKVLTRLNRKFADDLEAWAESQANSKTETDDEENEWIAFCESGGYEECTAGLDEWDD